MDKFNTGLDLVIQRIANELGTRRAVVVMFFLPFVALPGILVSHSIIALVLWFSSEFLQLFFLPVILRTSNQQTDRIEKLIKETHDYVSEELADIKDVANALHIHVTGAPYEK